ncbi:MAG TPA: adenosylcobalamin-dependent ribonucleoside-diphosphate reductase [Thermus scotoductus]|nr:adenosylcobalamin-dependent ribonucleoside-diphosphate reductase [Thermus scotoductus]
MERYFFDDHAQAIARRQYFQEGDGDILGMFRRVAREIAKVEKPEDRVYWEEKFYDLMASKRFSPGGRILAGAGTPHGNLLNCFVQGATQYPPESFNGIMEVAKKLALVTKVGGGNGVNLDPYRSKGNRQRQAVRGVAYLSARHPDVADFIRGLMRPPTNPEGEKEEIALKNFVRAVYGEVSPELRDLAERYGVLVVQEPPPGAIQVPDDMGGIVEAAKAAAALALKGLEPHVDFSLLRPEGAPIRGSGGTSSGPVSFLMEIFDNFLEWAALGGEEAGPVATLRYVYAPVLRVVRQGGCLHPDTLVHTDRGTLRLREIVDPFRKGWQRHTLSVATDQGWRFSPEGYNNGIAPTLRIVLENGLEVQGTPNHKLKVLREDGSREWVELQHLKPGDWVIWVLDEHTGTPVQLAPLDEPLHPNATPIRTPHLLTEELAFLLGFLWGEGFVSGDRIGLSVHEDEPMREEAKRLFRELFGLELREESKSRDKSVTLVVRSAPLVAWLRKNGLLKGKARELDVPRAIRQSPRPVLGAFLRGLFEADGSITAGYPMLTTASRRLAQDVMVLLGGLGIPSKLMRYNPLPGRFSKAEHYRVRVVTAKGLERYLERVGIPQGSRFEALLATKPDTRRESSWPLPHAKGLLGSLLETTQAGRKGYPSPHTALRKDLLRYMRGERQLTATGYTLVLEKAHHAGLSAPEFEFKEYYVRVASVEEGGSILTLDLSVEGNHTYLANGLVSHNTRRGAGMATLSIEHPDLLDFLTAKDLDREKAEGDISTFNISVLVTEAFMKALEEDALWPVTPIEVPGKYYPHPLGSTYTGQIPALPEREDGAKPVPLFGGKVPARWLWHEIAWHAWATGEPGLIFVDRINELSALKGLGPRYQIRSTNPCGEIPLTVGEPCDLGALNLAAYVKDGEFQMEEFRRDVHTAIRFLDNVLDVNRFALPDNEEAAKKLRRLGLGVMGLADALIKMGLPYSSEEAREKVYEIMSAMREEAIKASEALAKERGVFPLYEAHQEYFEALGIRPRRNVALLTVAPTGTTSMVMGVSSGIEPVFSPFVWRRIGGEYKPLLHPLFVELMETYSPHPDYEKDGKWDWEKIIAAIQEDGHGSVKNLPFVPEAIRRVFECAHDIHPLDHVRMQGAVQRAFDAEGYAANSLSKTINLPNHATVEEVEEAYLEAYRTGCKGITVYRDGSREFQVLTVRKEEKKAEEDKEEAPLASRPAPQAPSPAPQSGTPMYERPGRLMGFTDMVKLLSPDGGKRSFLVTVNMLGGRPIEVILTSGKAGDEANADSEALGRVVSIALQYGVPAEAIVRTLRGINGGLYGTYQGRLVSSKADLIAVALETIPEVLKGEATAAKAVPGQPRGGYLDELTEVPALSGGSLGVWGPQGGLALAGATKCPSCGEVALVREEGCYKCQACGYSKCG